MSAVPYEPTPDWTPTYGLDRQIARARKRMGEDRWQQLNREWDDTLVTKGNTNGR